MTTGRTAYLQNTVSTEAPCTSIQSRAQSATFRKIVEANIQKRLVLSTIKHFSLPH